MGVDLSLLPLLVEAEEWCGPLHPLDEAGPWAQRGDGVVAGAVLYAVALVPANPDHTTGSNLHLKYRELLAFWEKKKRANTHSSH